MYETLFSKKRIGSLNVPNRIVMTAMGNHMAKPGGEASDVDAAFYGARAKGGVGLVITECVTVDYACGKGNFGQMSADDDRFIPGLKQVADAVHANGSLIAAQVYHPGRQGIAAINGEKPMLAPSEVECQAVHQPTRAMTKAEIDEIVAKFGAASKRLKQAGYDAVEIHAAHGYLIGQFISPYTNKRTDEYGGNFENRMRFAKEIFEAIKESCGADYPVIVRISADEQLGFVGQLDAGVKLEEGVKIAQYFEKLGADAIDVSCGIYETMNTAWEPTGFDEGWKVHIPAEVKAAVSVPVIGVTVIRNPDYAEKVLQEGKMDFVGSARQFFADPEWGIKAKEGRIGEIRRCISCMYCMETLMEADITGVTVACAINYQGGREEQYGDAALKKDGNGRTVAVIGGGPAGLEAGIVLAKRGFRPVIFEKQDKVGGQLLYASVAPKKEKMLWLLEYQTNMLKKLGVEIRTGTAPSIEDLKKLDPYAVIVAQGSHPVLPRSIAGLDGANVYNVLDILGRRVALSGKNVVVIGSGMTGLETAEFLAEQGNKISVFEMADEIGPGMFFQNMIDIMGRLGVHKPEMFTKHKLVKIEGNKATFVVTDTNESKEVTADAFVVSLGVAQNAELIDAIKESFEKTFVVGDALECGRLAPAIGGGYKTAFEL